MTTTTIITAVVGAVALVAALWKPIASIAKGWWQAKRAHEQWRAAALRREIVEHQLSELQARAVVENRERELQHMIEFFERKEYEIQRERGPTYHITGPAPLAGEDPDLVKEAWRRFEKQRQLVWPRRGRGT